MKRIKTIGDVEKAIDLNEAMIEAINERIEWLEIYHHITCPKTYSILEKASLLLAQGDDEENLGDIWIDGDDVFILEEAYDGHYDKTFITRIELEHDEKEMPKATIVTWYAGIPDEDATEEFYRYYYVKPTMQEVINWIGEHEQLAEDFDLHFGTHIFKE